VVVLGAGDPVPDCPSCEGDSFARASLFATFAGEPAHQSDDERRRWLENAKEQIAEPGEYLAYEDDDRLIVIPLRREWTRIGRSLAADVRFDDPTVSRRHALIVRQADGVRVLDDRSLNGVFVNGERVEWRVLTDGDEIVVGRYRLHFLEAAADTVTAGAPPLETTG